MEWFVVLVMVSGPLLRFASQVPPLALMVGHAPTRVRLTNEPWMLADVSRKILGTGAGPEAFAILSKGSSVFVAVNVFKAPTHQRRRHRLLQHGPQRRIGPQPQPQLSCVHHQRRPPAEQPFGQLVPSLVTTTLLSLQRVTEFIPVFSATASTNSGWRLAVDSCRGTLSVLFSSAYY